MKCAVFGLLLGVLSGGGLLFACAATGEDSSVRASTPVPLEKLVPEERPSSFYFLPAPDNAGVEQVALGEAANSARPEGTSLPAAASTEGSVKEEDLESVLRELRVARLTRLGRLRGARTFAFALIFFQVAGGGAFAVGALAGALVEFLAWALERRNVRQALAKEEEVLRRMASLEGNDKALAMAKLQLLRLRLAPKEFGGFAGLKVAMLCLVAQVRSASPFLLQATQHALSTTHLKRPSL